jgi:phospholipid/cholesterol/gamma-HCH transport system substrate-binding protein
MKIANETKIGVLAVVAIAGLILGFNFLKGSSLFEHKKNIYAVFDSVEGMEVSNMVQINGLTIGSVSAIDASDKDLSRGIVVTITLKKDVNIPKNSLAWLNPGLLLSPTLVIDKGDATQFLSSGDTIMTKKKPGLIAQVEQNINPVVAKVGVTLESLDSLIQAVGRMFDPRLKGNFGALMANLAASSAQLQILLNAQTGALAGTLKNMNEFTGNLAKNDDKINRTLDNVEKTTSNLAASKIPETVAALQTSITELNGIMGKLNSPNGSIGLLLNDKKLYQNLEGTTRSLNILLDDVRLHPKRYINVSVFGRKDKTGPLMTPLSDSVSKPVNN